MPPKMVSEFIKLFTKIPKFAKSDEVHHYGENNNYPEIVEDAICESVTASQCSKLMASYIVGRGFGDEANKIIVNKKKRLSLLNFSREIAESLADHSGVFIRLNFNLNHGITDYNVERFASCRIGKIDDDERTGKIYVCDDWTDRAKVKKAIAVDVYNPLKSAFEAQVKKAGSLEKYNGQMFYFKFGKYIYPQAPIHPALRDADSEAQASIYKNTSLRKGFFGKSLVITRPIVQKEIKDADPELYQEQTTERDNFRETIKQFIGAENADGVLHLELDFQSDDIDEEIIFKNIDTNINDKLFAHTETSVSDNIRTCYNNVPAALVKSQDGKLFGTSGEAIKEMKLFYQDQTELERLALENIIRELLGKFETPIGDLDIVPLIEVPKTPVGPQPINKKKNAKSNR